MPGPDLERAAPSQVRLVLDGSLQKAWFDGRALAMGQRAFGLLRALAATPGQVLSPAQLMAAAWPGQAMTDGALRMHVAQLRVRLGPGVLLNVHGRGYCLALAAPELLARHDRPAAPRAHPSPERWRGVLPAWAGPLIGRKADLAAAAALLQHHRLVTVLGAGGIGKTRLAHALALDRRGAHRDGCWWVDLAM
jgi:DNA-binding winged helix-turn-helix (wHTH) protein